MIERAPWVDVPVAAAGRPDQRPRQPLPSGRQSAARRRPRGAASRGPRAPTTARRRAVDASTMCSSCSARCRPTPCRRPSAKAPQRFALNRAVADGAGRRRSGRAGDRPDGRAHLPVEFRHQAGGGGGGMVAGLAAGGFDPFFSPIVGPASLYGCYSPYAWATSNYWGDCGGWNPYLATYGPGFYNGYYGLQLPVGSHRRGGMAAGAWPPTRAGAGSSTAAATPRSRPSIPRSAERRRTLGTARARRAPDRAPVDRAASRRAAIRAAAAAAWRPHGHAAAARPVAATCGRATASAQRRRRVAGWSRRSRVPARLCRLAAQRAGRRLDDQPAEELEALARRTVRLHPGRDAEEPHLGAEGRVERVRPERAGMERPGDELPERRELGEARPRRVVVVRRGVVHVAGDPHDVVDAAIADEPQQPRDLELAAERRPGSPLATASKRSGPSPTTRPIGRLLAITFHVARARGQRAFEPRDLASPRCAVASRRRPAAGWRCSTRGSCG